MGMNNNEEKRSVGAHNLILEERGNLTITGVEDVDSFDEETVVVYTGLGELTVRGSGAAELVWADGPGLLARSVPSAFARYYAEALRELEE